jgi:ABC-type polysaccharide/polyol phosphate export permease
MVLQIQSTTAAPVIFSEEKLSNTLPPEIKCHIMETIGCASRDIRAAFGKFHVASTLARQDISGRYKRSRIGAFWLTIGMAVSIACIGFVFGKIFKIPLAEFLPYFTAGTIVWGLISSSLNEGCGAFTMSSGMILQVRLPLFTHILRLLTKDLLVFAHNLAILPVVFLIFLRPVDAVCFLAVPALALLLLNLSWMALVLATLCARFRDVAQIVQNAVGVLYFITPIMWKPWLLSGVEGERLLDWNPFYHLVNLVRAPLLGQFPDPLNWMVAGGMAIGGWLFALLFFGRFRNRIAYWL